MGKRAHTERDRSLVHLFDDRQSAGCIGYRCLREINRESREIDTRFWRRGEINHTLIIRILDSIGIDTPIVLSIFTDLTDLRSKVREASFIDKGEGEGMFVSEFSTGYVGSRGILDLGGRDFAENIVRSD
jgi:hypothetical protein